MPLVRRLQQALRREGYTVTLDGLFGRSTERAVRRFQDDRGLDVDGIVESRTWHLLSGRDRWSYVMPTGYPEDHAGLRRDVLAAESHRPIIERVCSELALQEELVLAIGSRQTGWGRHLKSYGARDKSDYGRGLLAIDSRDHEFARSGDWADPEENLRYGLSLFSRQMERFWTKLDSATMMRAGLASFNCGADNVELALSRGLDIDYFTAGRNYSADVLSRAGWFARRRVEAGVH